MSSEGDLTFEVAPDIVEHLGLNLYTNLPRVLVEFVANAHDADSPWVDVRMDVDAILAARLELRRAGRASEGVGNAARTLPPELSITIEDRGHGMSRNDLQTKFLRIARKRRPSDREGRSPDGRIVMGRKGIGKLAAFGVAHRMEVVSKAQGESHATRIVLDYSALAGKDTIAQVPVHSETLPNGGGLEPSGTRVTLSNLVLEPTGSQQDTILAKIADHFSIVRPEDFEIRFNGQAIPAVERDFAFEYPNPGTGPGELTLKTLKMDSGADVDFEYRIRFTQPGKQLNARERGVRIYAHGRLACAPDLLDLGTGMHGFQNTHYLDGVVVADFIDSQTEDYISSDRQSLRWETPLLTKLRAFLTEEMKQACIDYQGQKTVTLNVAVKSDAFTRTTIEQADLPSHRRDVAFRIAAKLAAACTDETKDQYYRDTLPLIVRGLGYGQILGTIAAIADKEHPGFSELVAAVAELTGAEWDDFTKIVSGRLRGIEALRKLFQERDFAEKKNEAALHELLKSNPWLIDPTFWQFLTSNVTETTLADELAKHLKVGPHVAGDYDPDKSSEAEPYQKNKRPDLVFLLANRSLGRVVIVELKAPNTPLQRDHLIQLKDYMDDTRDYLASLGKDLKVEGYLIGSRGKPRDRSEGVVGLRRDEKERGVSASWQVFDLAELLERAEDAHRELLNVYQDAAGKAVSPADSPK